MTFIISPNGVNNTQGTLAKFGGGGSVKIGGNFENSGDVEVDIRADLNIIGNVLNSGKFSIKDYLTEEHYKLIEKAILELDGESKELLEETLVGLKNGNNTMATSKFKHFLEYIKNHPEIITSSVQVVLQLLSIS
ncbi:MAG: hypothetical protein US52_C0041G0008 [candidate division WS6 bacterium GW2011_GWA2_37_6]|uniref:Uncharacterized protein n=1 Tax=candidate division WS6 bacterium GW2011_GWA2_37_6 TaxID=1619087 RepID=A0A0G0GY05_9BACT|nr:MAG: hypothetical protein US52_C0041G0008 [candidate division WS6 bacterium GW2011_GWA2_37_6]